MAAASSTSEFISTAEDISRSRERCSYTWEFLRFMVGTIETRSRRMAKQIGTVAKRVVARSIALSRARQTVAAVLPDAGADIGKGTASAKPAAKSTNKGGTSQPARVKGRPVLPSGRWERTAIPERGAPPPAVRCHLRLVIGGRDLGGGGNEAPADRAAQPGGPSARIRLVR